MELLPLEVRIFFGIMLLSFFYLKPLIPEKAKNKYYVWRLKRNLNKYSKEFRKKRLKYFISKLDKPFSNQIVFWNDVKGAFNDLWRIDKYVDMKLFSEEHIKIASEGMKEFFEARHKYLKRR